MTQDTGVKRETFQYAFHGKIKRGQCHLYTVLTIHKSSIHPIVDDNDSTEHGAMKSDSLEQQKIYNSLDRRLHFVKLNHSVIGNNLPGLHTFSTPFKYLH